MWILWIAFLLMGPQQSPSQEEQAPRLEVSFCRPKIPEVIRRSRASFNAVYSFSVGEPHQPVDVVEVRGGFVGVEAISRCIDRWRLPGMRVGSRVVVALYWEHGVGISMSITGEQINQKITLAGDGCPYCPDRE